MKPAFRGTSKGMIIALIILSVFVFMLFAFIFVYQTSIETRLMSPLVNPVIKYNVYFVISLAAIGFAVGASTYYFMSNRVENTQIVARKSGEVLLRFLSDDEEAIVRSLIDKKGSMLQAEVSRLPRQNKVKTHRILKRLADKQIIVLEQYGKTNSVTLLPEIREALE